MTRRPNPSTTPPIPLFALYGETIFRHKPEFVHIEDIRARSERNGWVIKPHRHGHLFQILCMFSGSAEVQVDEHTSTHKGSWVIATPTGVVHGFKFSPDTDGLVLSLSINMLGLDAENHIGTLLDGVLARPRIVKFQLNSLLLKELSLYLRQIRQELVLPRQDQQIALFSLVKMVLVSLRRRLHQEHVEDAEEQSGAQLTNKFRHLLEQHYKQHWKIGDYANALHVSASTLNRACHENLGGTAKKLIQERLHVEAKRRLIYTKETLDQISFDLGYKDAAYFSRVFKQVEGVPPMSYRRHVDMS
jgi:AraC family transcriptional activator of pobA